MASLPLSCADDFITGSPVSGVGFGPIHPRPPSERHRHDEPSAALAKMVESEIIPRLMLAHRPSGVPSGALSMRETRLGRETAEAFARMVLSKESDALLVYANQLLRDGVALESLYIDLLAPAARRLGDFWSDDLISFADVTIGLGRLQQLVRLLSLKASDAAHYGSAGKSAFFAPCPGEQHTFGLVLVEDFFRRAGWRTWIEPAASQGEIADTLNGCWFDLLGLSLSGAYHDDDRLERIASTIICARKVSRNPDIKVMVGGRLFVEHPELVSAVGADATASSESEALRVAETAVLQLGGSY